LNREQVDHHDHSSCTPRTTCKHNDLPFTNNSQLQHNRAGYLDWNMLVTHFISPIKLSPVSSKVGTISLLLETLLDHSHSLLDSTSKSITGYPHMYFVQRTLARSPSFIPC